MFDKGWDVGLVANCKRGLRLYLAGPMSGKPYWNRDAFAEAEKRLSDFGHTVINPHDLDAKAGLKPHPTGEVDPAIVPECLRRDLAELVKCDGIALLPGWANSPGCRFEVLVARTIGLSVWDAETLNPLPDTYTGSAAFHKELRLLGELHDRKQQDYGTDQDPFANIRGSQDFGIPAWLGAVVRLNDKVNRLKTYACKGTLANEGVEDSFRDLAVYAVIALVLFREEQAACGEVGAP